MQPVVNRIERAGGWLPFAGAVRPDSVRRSQALGSGRPWQRNITLVIVALCLGALAGCDVDSMTSPAAPAVCASIGAQCQLPDGPLGVCQQSPCAAGVAPPCFKCTSQH